MSTPRPMTTPDLANLLTRKSPAVGAQAARGAVTRDESTKAVDGIPASPPPAEPLATLDAATDAAPAPTESVPIAPRQYLRSLALYLPRAVHQQLGATANETGATRTALILDSINHTHTQLAAALAVAAPTTPSTSQDLFAVPQRKTNAEPSVQTTIRVTDAQHAAIAALVTEHTTNRSLLITTALRLHLGAP